MKIGCDKNKNGYSWGYNYDDSFDYKHEFRIGWFYICWIGKRRLK